MEPHGAAHVPEPVYHATFPATNSRVYRKLEHMGAWATCHNVRQASPCSRKSSVGHVAAGRTPA
jgi:hypothetical protein